MSYNADHENEIIVFAETNFRNTRQKFGIKTDDRRRHVYILGKSGVGKTTLIENMILEDIYAGHGVGFVDPHGDSSEKILNYIPSHRVNDIVYFNPADVDNPIGFNILETVDDTHKHLVASGLMGVFKKIWEDMWSARMEYILQNAILALLDYPGSTLLGINRLLSDKEYRQKVIAQIKDPVVKAFWVKEFSSYQQKFAVEAVAPIQNKVGQFLSASIIRNIVAQVKSTINIREIMDQGKIFIMNLAKGRIGEDSSRLLGGMLITKLQLAAMERVDIPEKERKDFYLYVDEFQNFATGSFAEILSEARKYRLNLILAHQYIAQLDEKVRDAIFGNVGTHIVFRLGAADATVFEEEFAPTFTPEDLVNLANHDIYLKLMINGAASQPFSAHTLPPIGSPTESAEKVIKVSRERYSEKRASIEEKIERWWGFDEQAQTIPQAPSAAPFRRGGKDVHFSAVHGANPSPVRREMEVYAPQLSAPSSIKKRENREANESSGGLNWNAKRPSLYTAICAKCNNEVVSKFKPDPKKPFYCDDCLPIIKEKMRLQSEGPRAMVLNSGRNKSEPRREMKPQTASLSTGTVEGLSLSALVPRPSKPEKNFSTGGTFRNGEVKNTRGAAPLPQKEAEDGEPKNKIVEKDKFASSQKSDNKTDKKASPSVALSGNNGSFNKQSLADKNKPYPPVPIQSEKDKEESREKQSDKKKLKEGEKVDL
ncbi:MAG: type IV secretion system DNA-binding domain-containing protein [Patescibacteria group bacterium]